MPTPWPPRWGRYGPAARVAAVPYLAAMSRGFVLWPDEHFSSEIRSISTELLDRGLPTVASQPHHIPHVSLIVADDLAVAETLDAVADVPSSPIPLLIESAAIVPGGHLLLACTPIRDLLVEQARVHRAAAPHADNPWAHYAPDAWLPHLTLARSLTPENLAVALPIVLARLPMRGSLTSGGIEDPTTGERWHATTGDGHRDPRRAGQHQEQ